MDRLTLSILNAAGQLDDSFGFHRASRINPRRVFGFAPKHVIAFNDDTDDPPADPANPPSEPPDGLLTQEEYNRGLQERLKRERESQQRRLEALGYKSFEDLEKAEQERRSAAAEAQRQAEEAQRKQLEQQQKWQELREFDQQKAKEQIEAARREAEEARRERETLTKQVRSSQISTALQSAAVNLGAYKPEQISTLLAGQISHAEDGRMIVLGSDGKPRTNGRGEDLSVEDFVKEFIEANPHFQRAAPGRGSGGSGGGPTGGAAGGLDLKNMSISDIQKNKEEIIQRAKRGEIKLS